MTTNPYFRKHVPSEQRLIDSLTIEAIKIHGYDYIYIPRELVSQDTILGDVVSKFTDINRIEMYFNSPDAGFAPSPPATGHLISRFGLEIPDEGTSASTSSDDESSSNTIWVILGAVVVLGAAGAAFQLRRKKK
jgi:LPXTG-motif cell wall-anchored protein